MPKVLMKIQLDGTEIRNVAVEASNKETLIEQAKEWSDELRQGSAKLFRVLLYSNFFEDYLDLLDDYEFRDRDKFRLILSSGRVERTPQAGIVACPRDPGVYRMRGVVGDTKIDLEIDKPLAGILLTGAVAVGVAGVATMLSGGKSPASNAMKIASAILAKPIANKKD